MIAWTGCVEGVINLSWFAVFFLMSLISNLQEDGERVDAGEGRAPAGSLRVGLRCRRSRAHVANPPEEAGPVDRPRRRRRERDVAEVAEEAGPVDRPDRRRREGDLAELAVPDDGNDYVQVIGPNGGVDLSRLVGTITARDGLRVRIILAADHYEGNETGVSRRRIFSRLHLLWSTSPLYKPAIWWWPSAVGTHLFGSVPLF